jgi:tripartite-type tricarboxylate transporter receptor subunit TctC
MSATLKVMIQVLAACAFALSAQAQEFPAKPLTLIVPYAPGGATDVAARIIADGLRKTLAQNVVVENKPGAGAMIGAEHVAKQVPADGYTLLLGTTVLPGAPIFVKDLRFDVQKDLAPITLLADSALILASPYTAPWNSLAEMANYAKANPGKLNYGSTGPGNTELYIEAIKQHFGVDIVFVQYKGSGPTTTALYANEIQLTWLGTFRAQPDAQDRKVKLLAVSGPKRLSEVPTTPTFQEVGVSGIDHFWVALFTTGGTPRAAVDKLHQASVRALKDPEVESALTKNTFYIVGSTPEQLRQTMASNLSAWTAIAKRAGAKVQ